ncbi:MAG: hypothetical protein LQ346_006106 [Caloplaca aetnensis]|nr:MAG: hypothetical protein LQ346_006106 [Caloplaca aetnensis]
MTPTIALVPGFWEGIEPFGDVIHLLRKQGFPIMICPLVSTGTTSPGNPSMEDDIAAIRNPIEAAVMEGGDIVVVMHSAGGFLGSNAIEGLGAKARKEQGRTGGVVGLVFITGALFPEGFEHGDLPFGEVKDGALLCADAKNVFFNDVDAVLSYHWIQKMRTQPASGWNGTVTYCAWKEIPSVYLVCEADQAIPPSVQIQMAKNAGSKIETCAGGHMVQIVMPQTVAETIENAATSFLRPK